MHVCGSLRIAKVDARLDLSVSLPTLLLLTISDFHPSLFSRLIQKRTSFVFWRQVLFILLVVYLGGSSRTTPIREVMSNGGEVVAKTRKYFATHNAANGETFTELRHECMSFSSRVLLGPRDATVAMHQVRDSLVCRFYCKYNNHSRTIIAP